jgi:hypothetical protein
METAPGKWTTAEHQPSRSRGGFVLHVFLAWFGTGLVLWSVFELRAWSETKRILRQSVPPVSFDDVEARAALQRLADSLGEPFRVSTCGDVAARRLTLHTDHAMPLEEFVPLIARRLDVAADLRRPRRVQGAPSYPHLYRPEERCSRHSYVVAYPHADSVRPGTDGGRTTRPSARAGTLRPPR